MEKVIRLEVNKQDLFSKIQGTGLQSDMLPSIYNYIHQKADIKRNYEVNPSGHSMQLIDYIC